MAIPRKNLSDHSAIAAPAAARMAPSRLDRLLRSLSQVGGVSITLLFAAFVGLPLLALFLRAPLRLLQTAECCYIVREALSLSLTTSLTTTALTFLIGTPVAYTLARRQFPGRRIVQTIIELPLTLPPVVAGVALLLVFGRNGYLGRHLAVWGFAISFTRVAVVMAQFMVASPHYLRTATAAFQTVPEDLLNAAQSLGAGPIRRFFTIVLPLSRRMLFAGLALTWARAIGEFGATIMFAGNFPGRTQTMPLAILTTMQQNLHAGIVLAVVMLVCCLAVFLLVNRLTAHVVPGQWPGSCGKVVRERRERT